MEQNKLNDIQFEFQNKVHGLENQYNNVISKQRDEKVSSLHHDIKILQSMINVKQKQQQQKEEESYESTKTNNDEL